MRLHLLALLFAGACSQRSVEQPPDYRVDACTTWCVDRADPECGEPTTLSVDECIDKCAADSGARWVTDEDGTDHCKSEQLAYFECIGALDCDERRTFFEQRQVSIDETLACYDVLVASVECEASSR